jgi:hypothetical protein
MPHDFDLQRRETFETFAELARGPEPLPATSEVEFYFLADTEDREAWAAAERALRALGLRTERDGDTLIARTPAMAIAPEPLWSAERRATEAVLPHGFEPDGWEFGFD